MYEYEDLVECYWEGKT